MLCRRVSRRQTTAILSRHILVNGTRHQSSARHFYQNKQLEYYASKEANRLTLRQLVFFGRSINEERLIKSANYVRTELPVRIAHRLRDLQRLPYIVVTQEGVAKVYELYWAAFEMLRQYPQVTTLAENEKFCEFLTGLLNEHATVIPSLSLGLSLSSPHLPPSELDALMRRMLVSRISRRVIAEHHIALSKSFTGRERKSVPEPHVGIIFTGLEVKRSIEKCAKLLQARPLWIEDSDNDHVHRSRWPDVEIEGHLDTQFAYIREHLEYIVFELLKNVNDIFFFTINSPLRILKSMRATVLKHQGASKPPPIRATIVASTLDVGIRISDQGGGIVSLIDQINSPSDLFSFSHIRNATRMDHTRLGALRSASSSESGVWATVGEQVEKWHAIQNTAQSAHATRPRDPELGAGIGLQSRIGIGLPMSYIFATYFGGSLGLMSLDGWGTDVYVRLPKLGTNLEGIEV